MSYSFTVPGPSPPAAQPTSTYGYSGLFQGNVTVGALLGLNGYAIASLPTPAAAGALAYVTNGVASPTYNSTVSTTGSSVQLVFYNGSNWTYH